MENKNKVNELFKQAEKAINDSDFEAALSSAY